MSHNGSGVTATFLGMTKTQFLLTLGVVTLLIGALSVITFAYAVSANNARSRDNRALATQTYRVQCAQRKSVQEQIEATADFLATRPGSTFFGGEVSRQQLKDQLERQREFRATMDDLDCRPYGGGAPVP